MTAVEQGRKYTWGTRIKEKLKKVDRWLLQV